VPISDAPDRTGAPYNDLCFRAREPEQRDSIFGLRDRCDRSTSPNARKIPMCPSIFSRWWTNARARPLLDAGLQARAGPALSVEDTAWLDELLRKSGLRRR